MLGQHLFTPTLNLSHSRSCAGEEIISLLRHSISMDRTVTCAIIALALLSSGCFGGGDGGGNGDPAIVLGCIDANATNFDADANEDDGSCEFEITPPPPVAGCTDENATNYAAEANQDDGSCEYQNPPPPPTNGSLELPPEVPSHFSQWMALPVSGTTYHLAVGEPCADDSNDGLAVTCDGGSGPLSSLQGLENVSIQPGDEILFHAGTYDLGVSKNTGGLLNGGGIGLSINGTETAPLRIRAAVGEEVWWDAGVDAEPYLPNDVQGYMQDWEAVDAILIRGDHLIIENINVMGCGNPTCIQWSAHHIIWSNSTIIGGAEDGIKATSLASDGLMWNLSFRGFSDNAIDAYGIQGLWLVQSEFTDNDPRFNSQGDNGTPFWTKGGARDVWLIENNFHDMTVKHFAMMLGGCCWHNWDDAYTGGVANPVAIGVHALRNTLSNISHGASAEPKWMAAMGIEGAHDVEMRENLFLDVEAVFGVKATIKDGDRVEAVNLTFTNNTVIGGAERGLHHIAHIPTNLIIDSNTYYVDIELVSTRNTTYYATLAEWQGGQGWDLNSVQLPEDQAFNGSAGNNSTGSGTGDPPPVGGITEFFLNEHRVVWNNTSDESQYLYVFMPGSGQNASEERTRWTVLAAAEVGMRGIGLTYQNDGMVATWCDEDNDPDCMEKIRNERIYGQDTSTLVDCTYEESVIGLLVTLLGDLDDAHPEMGWDGWIAANGTPEWSKIVLGGHSQGGGNAALIARDHEVARVVMYGTPFDRDPSGAVDIDNETYSPAPWITDSHITPSERYYAAFHVEDNSPYTFVLTGNLEILLGLGNSDSVDVMAAGSGGLVSGSRLFHAQNTLNPSQSAHTYMLLQQFMALHEFMLSDGL